jgi:Rrf2 family transcriptional regulator, nitric oxide-sensitive transcriptional repressor
MISQSVEYALRAVVSLARWHDQPRTARQLADETRVSSTYLSKIMAGLVRSELVSSQRGPGGGFVLRCDPAEMTVWDVVEAVEPFPRIRRCPLEQHGSQLCPLHRRLDEALASAERAFRSSRIADLLLGIDGSTPLCHAPAQERLPKPDARGATDTCEQRSAPAKARRSAARSLNR